MLGDVYNDDFDDDYNKLDEELDFEVGEFFRENLIKTRKAVTNEDFNKFAALGSNGARVAFILNYAEAHELPVEVENYEKKNETKTDIIKNTGNRAFGLGHYEVAIEEYNNAILAAPKEKLGVILANRSAAFYHLDKFELALGDCNEALMVGYPKHLRYKLEERRARCFLGLKCHANAMNAFKNALLYLDDAQITDIKKKKHETDIRIMLGVMEKGRQQLKEAQQGLTDANIIEIENSRLKSEDKIPSIKVRNPIYPSCSASIEIRQSYDDVGRYAVAVKDIEPGDVLVVERPHCSSLLEEYRGKHCHRCLIRNVAPFPASCYTCSSVAYCSPKCQNLDKMIHNVECQLLGALWCSHASITCILAIRAVIQKPFTEFIKIHHKIRDKTDELQISKAKPYLSKDYKAFYNLVSHEDKRTTEDLFHRAYIAAWLLRVLKTSSYFPLTANKTDSAEVELSEGELAVADAILHHLQLLQFNSHEISAFVRSERNADLSKGINLFIGGGVYPTVALFNHACNPGVVRYFVGNTIIVRAIRSIPTGNEISENYGPIFTEVEEDERKRVLRMQYWFDCDCEACKDHWPLLKNIDSNILRFKCSTGSSCANILSINMDSETFIIPCSKCGRNTNIIKGLKALQDTDMLYKMATNNIKSGNHKDALNQYLKILNILDETLALPMKDYHICQQGIRQCMLALGNVYTAPKH
ncbi:PREDICTED: SET and MYND domain-containing protein 4 [Ceratosolen solmsi marchali]|uniref:Protein-lysine N-methyltransferase SMYD4 n=1 Tax=Ceratosolen solmsi marchali TaxID=326594 RepID=A0AAJ6YHJ3_9HYME|nr:PREDICTED: SET and MYND domain-containing protein 4 [Ceratosolen solmsi marchali]